MSIRLLDINQLARSLTLKSHFDRLSREDIDHIEHSVQLIEDTPSDTTVNLPPEYSHNFIDLCAISYLRNLEGETNRDTILPPPSPSCQQSQFLPYTLLAEYIGSIPRFSGGGSNGVKTSH